LETFQQKKLDRFSTYYFSNGPAFCEKFPRYFCVEFETWTFKVEGFWERVWLLKCRRRRVEDRRNGSFSSKHGQR